VRPNMRNTSPLSTGLMHVLLWETKPQSAGSSIVRCTTRRDSEREWVGLEAGFSAHSDMRSGQLRRVFYLDHSENFLALRKTFHQ
jgi:hypothetical protein